MLSRPGLGRCRVVQAQADVESSRPGSISSRPGPGRCRVVRGWADVESFEVEPMSSCTGPGCRVVRAETNVKLSGPGSMSSRVGPRPG